MDPGTLTLSRTDNDWMIERADPCIWVSDEVLDRIIEDWTAVIEDGNHLGWRNAFCELEYLGPLDQRGSAVLRLHAANADVTYVLKSFDRERCAWLAYWPD